MYENDNLAVGYALGRDANTNNGYGNGFGADGWWVLIILFALFGGWGNGFGGFGGNNGALTRADMCEEFNFNGVENGIRGIQQGLCDGFYAMNTSLLNGFNGVNTNILTSANQTQQGIANLGFQLQQCCCELGRGQDRIACENATNTARVIEASNSNTQRILDYLCNEKISGLQAENAALTAQLSQNAQTNTIISTLMPVARPAYITCSPYESAFGYGRNGNCGCNSGCGCC
ncbi:MAG: hypothetical protein ACI4PF_02330 [Christensenellales bacterium]